MDIEKTMQFILEQQAQFSLHIQALQQAQSETNHQIQALQQAQGETNRQIQESQQQIRALITVAGANGQRMDAFEHDFREFLARFDAYLRGDRGDGKGAS
jgi:predicted  nucleic acid-binding Zn-ribbon protein